MIGRVIYAGNQAEGATPTAVRREYGRTQVGEFGIIGNAANSGLVKIATVMANPVLIKSVVLRSNGATTSDLTSAAIKGGDSQVVEFISAAAAIQANLDSVDKQVAWTGAVRLPETGEIYIDLQGTDANAVYFTVIIEYMAAIDGGYLL